jgi:hypothetical protein
MTALGMPCAAEASSSASWLAAPHVVIATVSPAPSWPAASTGSTS